jgi:hypothetical protein
MFVCGVHDSARKNAMTDLPEGETGGDLPATLCKSLRAILLLGFFSTGFIRQTLTPVLDLFSRIAPGPGTILSLFKGSLTREVSMSNVDKRFLITDRPWIVIGFCDDAKIMLADQFPTTSTIFRSNPACDRRPAMSLL